MAASFLMQIFKGGGKVPSILASQMMPMQNGAVIFFIKSKICLARLKKCPGNLMSMNVMLRKFIFHST